MFAKTEPEVASGMRSEGRRRGTGKCEAASKGRWPATFIKG